MAGYDFNKTIGGFKGEPIKGSMLGKNVKSRGLLSNNLPFRLANGLAPSNEYGFLFPTGTEAGAVWRFGSSGEQYQDTVGITHVTAVGQAIGLILDARFGLPGDTIVPNGTFDANTANWTPIAGTFVSVAGEGVLTNSGASAATCVSDAIQTVIGQQYQAVVTLRSPSTNNVLLRANTSNASAATGVINSVTAFSASNVTVAFTFIATTTTTYLWLVQTSTTINDTLIADNVILRTFSVGNHLSQATTTARPLTAIETVGTWGQSVYSGRFDGVDDGMVSPTLGAPPLTNNMDVIMAVKRQNVQGILSSAENNTKFLGCYNAGAGGLTTSSVAGFTLFVNGNSISDDRVALASALTLSQWCVLEYRNIDLSSWLALGVSNYGAAPWFASANYGDVVFCPAQSTANRNLARTLVGASVGLNL